MFGRREGCGIEGLEEQAGWGQVGRIGGEFTGKVGVRAGLDVERTWNEQRE